MRWIALAFIVWPAAFAVTLAGLTWTAPPAEYIGRVVLERAPYCDLLVVQTPLGYVTAVDLAGNAVVLSGARQVTGDLYRKGRQRLSVDAIATMEVLVSHFDTNWLTARSRFDSECQPPDIAADFVASY
jgi:hypothetical protein